MFSLPKQQNTTLHSGAFGPPIHDKQRSLSFMEKDSFLRIVAVMFHLLSVARRALD